MKSRLTQPILAPDAASRECRIGRTAFKLRCDPAPQPAQMQAINKIIARALVDRARRKAAHES